MAGAGPRDPEAAADRADEAPPPHATAGAAAPSAPAAEPRPAPLDVPPTPGPTAADETGVETDRFATLVAALTLHVTRDELAASAAAWRHLLALPLSRAQRTAVDAAAQPACLAAAECLARAHALLAAGHARSAVAALAPLTAAPVAGVTACDLLPPEVAASAKAMLAARVASDASVPAPKPLARGRALTAWIAGEAVRGACVASDADAVTLLVRRDDGASFPRAAYADCEADAPTGAEAIEFGFAAARSGEPLLARAWSLVAAARGASTTARWLQLDAALR